MQCIVARINVKPEAADAYEATFAKQAALVQANEPGNLMYQLCKDRKEAGKYTVLELYESEAAIKAHGAHLAKLRDPKTGDPELVANVGRMLGPPEVQIMPVVGMAGPPRSDLDSAQIWVLASFEALADKTKEFEQATLKTLVEIEAKEPKTAFYNLLGPYKTENGVAHYYQFDAYQDKEALDFHGKQDHMIQMMKARRPFAPTGKFTGIFLQKVGKSHAKKIEWNAAAKL